MAACLPAIVIAGGITATVVAKLSCRGQIAYAEAEMLLSTQLEPLEDMPLGQISLNVNALAAGQAAACKMFETIERIPKINPYDNRFLLHVPSGTIVALVGQSGSGKSTVIHLVESFRFYASEAEQVLIDGVNINQLRWFKEKIGLVSKEPIFLFCDFNEGQYIPYGKQNASDERIRPAVQLANAEKSIDKLPLGHLKEPKNSSSDEATNAVDAESERIVQAAMVKLVTNQTVVIVANCLITVRNADCIMVVSKGKIVEKGCNARPAVLVLPLSRTTFEAVILKRSPSVKVKHILRGFPGPICVYETAERSEDRTEKDPTEIEKREKVSVTRLANVNRSEVPILLIESIAAVIVFPIFGLLLSTSINMFQKPAKELENDPKFWAIFGAVGARLSTDASAVRSVVGDALGLIIQNIAIIAAGLVIAFTVFFAFTISAFGVSNPRPWLQTPTKPRVPQLQYLKFLKASLKLLEQQGWHDTINRTWRYCIRTCQLLALKKARCSKFPRLTVALVGENGNGKSTVISLAERFYNPEQNYCGCGSPPYHYKNADIISVVKNGVIEEKGRHDALMKITDGTYASLTALHMSS
ncbi:hypothetical protein WN943_012631 [Citrus x changshan-huyou]